MWNFLTQVSVSDMAARLGFGHGGKFRFRASSDSCRGDVAPIRGDAVEMRREVGSIPQSAKGFLLLPPPRLEFPVLCLELPAGAGMREPRMGTTRAY